MFPFIVNVLFYFRVEPYLSFMLLFQDIALFSQDKQDRLKPNLQDKQDRLKPNLQDKQDRLNYVSNNVLNNTQRLS